VLAGTLATATMATPTSAHVYWRGWGWGLGGLALGVTIGAALARPVYALTIRPIPVAMAIRLMDMGMAGTTGPTHLLLRRLPPSVLWRLSRGAPGGDPSSALALIETRGFSFDHLVGAGEHGGRHFEAKNFRGLEIDQQLDLRSLYNRKLRGLLTLENPTSVCADLAVVVSFVASVAEQAARGDERPILRHHRHPVTHRQRSELFGPAAEEYVGSDDEGTGL
jgi:hypothetical protein